MGKLFKIQNDSANPTQQNARSMKRLSSEELKALEGLKRRRWEKEIQRREIRAIKKGLKKIPTHYEDGQPKYSTQYIPAGAKEHDIVAPVDINLSDNIEATLEFFDRILRWVFDKQLIVNIDLGRVRSMAPECALILAAICQRCLELHPNSLNGKYPLSKCVCRLLKEIGFDSFLQIRPVRVSEEQRSKRRYIKMESGNRGTTAIFPDFISNVFGDVARFSNEKHREVENALKAGLQEAMLNVSQHAYKDTDDLDYPIGEVNRWWMAGYRDAENKEIGFMFLDQGSTIPVTLPRTFPEIFKAAIVKAKSVVTQEVGVIDGELINAAMSMGRTSKGVKGHGLGLNDLKEFIDWTTSGDASKNGKGSLRILSGKGEYLYINEGNEEFRNLQAKFNGTLVIWRLAARDTVEWANDDN